MNFTKETIIFQYINVKLQYVMYKALYKNVCLDLTWKEKLQT